MMIIVACLLLFGFATSEKYIVILFPFTYPPDEQSVFAKLSIDTRNEANTMATITHGNRSIWQAAGSNISISTAFPSISGIFIISLEKTADVVVEIRKFKRSYVFNIQSLKGLGWEYILVSSSEISQRYTCRISSNSTTDVVVNIRAPPRLQHALTLYGTCSGNRHCILKTGNFIEISSGSPLYQTVIASSDTLVIFCKDDSIFQVLPKNSCGSNFQVSCPMFNLTNVSNCTVRINTVQSKRQYIKIDRSLRYINNFFEISLEKGQSLIIQSEYDVCVLFFDNYYDNSGNSVIRTKMLSSSPTETTFSTSEATSAFVNTLESNQANTLLTTIVNTVSTQENNTLTLNTKFRKIEINRASTTLPSILPEFNKTNLLLKTSISTSSVDPINTDLHKVSTQHNNNNLSTTSAFTGVRALINTFLPIISSGYVSTTSEGLLLRRDSTTSHRNYTKYVLESKKICNCVCSSINHSFNVTRSTKVEFQELIVQLRVNKSELSSEVRRTSCAKDDRQSAQRIGLVGIVVIILVMTTIVSFDVINLFQKWDKFRKHSKRPKRRMPIACREQ